MRKTIIEQLFKFGIVGLISFGIDYGLLFLFTEWGGVDYLISGGISFGVSVVVNYLLSMRFVFEPREGVSKAREFSVFLLLSISGLLLTEMLMWYSVERLHFHYLFSKIVVTGIVMVYNFVTRKIFIEKKK